MTGMTGNLHRCSSREKLGVLSKKDLRDTSFVGLLLSLPLSRFLFPDEPSISDINHPNGIYSALGENSPVLAKPPGSSGNFSLEHGGIPTQDQFHDLRSNSPYGMPPSPGSLQAISGHPSLMSSLVYPDHGLGIVGQGGQSVPQPMRVLSGNGPNSDLSSGSSGGYPDFPASPASWLDEVDHAQF